MLRILPILSCSVYLGACSFGGSGTTAISSTEMAGGREISASLRASCPGLPVARAQNGGTSVAVPVAASTTRTVSYEIVDTRGAYVASSSYTLTGVPTRAEAFSMVPGYAWDGKDSQGKQVATGHYFVFAEVRDSTGTLLGTSEKCVGVVAN